VTEWYAKELNPMDVLAQLGWDSNWSDVPKPGDKPKTAAQIPKPLAPTPPPAQKKYDCIVVGGGAVGCSFARDMASMGYSSLIIEDQDSVGGTWRRHNYPGLKLHMSGEQYRCLSVPPPWTLTHKASEYYRPVRDELLAYVKSLTDHPLVTVLLNTQYQSESARKADGTRTVQTDRGEFIGRFVLLAKGLSFTGTGPPIMPYKFKEGGTNAPEVQHSSECHPEVWARAKAAKRLVVLGAGKAGCDILNFGCESSWPNVTWVHRGMHLFLNRELTHAAMKDGAKQMTMAIGELINEAKKKENAGKTYEELGLEKYLEIDGKKHAVYLKAAGPITGRPHKSGSGITYKHEIEALNDYKQLRMEKMEANDDGSVTITSVPKEDGSVETLTLEKGDFLCLATGQSSGENWPPPRYEHGFAVVHQLSPTGPLNSIPMLGLATDYLRGVGGKRVDEMAARAAEYQKYKSRDELAKTYERKGQKYDIRGVDGQMMGFMRQLNTDYMLHECKYEVDMGNGTKFIVPQDLMYRPQWVTEWYAKELNPMDVLAQLGWDSNWSDVPKPGDKPKTAAQMPTVAPTPPTTMAAAAGPSVLGAEGCTLTVGCRVKTFYPKSLGGNDTWVEGKITAVMPASKKATIAYDAGFTWTGTSSVMVAI